MKFKPHISNQVVTILGGAFLLLFILSAWIPQPCPVLRKYLIGGCPKPLEVHETAEQTVLDLHPNQTIKDTTIYFSVPYQVQNGTTKVKFYFYGDLKHTATLQIKTKIGFEDLAVVNSPLLNNLTWPALSNQTVRIFQKNLDFEDFQSFTTQLPTKTKLAADKAAAKAISLSPSQYTPLDQLTDPNSVDFILTTYTPPEADAQWSYFNRLLDLNDAAVTKDNRIEMAITLKEKATQESPFYISSVNVDYAQR